MSIELIANVPVVAPITVAVDQTPEPESAAPATAAAPEEAKKPDAATSSAPATQSTAEPVKRAYPAAAEKPTQEGPKGIRFDFNDGCRVSIPESDQPWRVRISDLETGNILFQTEIKGGWVNSAKRYFVPFKVEISQGEESLLTHDYSAKDRE